MASFISTYVDYASGRTNAPEMFHKLCGLAVCAASLENRVYLDAGFGRVYPSLWLCLIGSSHVRKSSALNIAVNLLGQAKKETELPQDFSREALIEHLAQRPYGLLRWSEIGVALESMNRDYNSGVMSTLTDIWDSRPAITRLTKGAGLITIEYPALSILAAGKPRWFKEYIKPKQVGTGFLGRWLFAWEEASTGYQSFFGRNGYGGDSEAYQRGSLVDRLAELTSFSGVMEPGNGKARLDGWLEEMEDKWDSDDKDPAEFSKRAGTQVAKLAIAIQASQGTSYLASLDEKAVTQAIELWRYLYASGRRLMAEIIGHSLDADEIERVWAVIGGARRVRQRDLLRKTKMKLGHLLPVIETLQASERVTVERERLEGGGLDVIWYVASE